MENIRLFHRIFLFLFLFLGAVFGVVNTASAQTLILTPSSGDAPVVSGTLSGSEWCDGAELLVGGSGVSGEAWVDPQGTLSGQFSVRGSAGDVITVSISGNCPTGAPIAASANFSFNAPPPPESPEPRGEPSPPPPPQLTPERQLPSPSPDAMALPAPPAPSLEERRRPPPAPTPEREPPSPSPYERALPTPPLRSPEPTPAKQSLSPPPYKKVLPSPAAMEGTLNVFGCTPSPQQIKIELLPLPLFAPQKPKLQIPSPSLVLPKGTLDATVLTLPVQATKDPHQFTFKIPSLDVGNLYQVSAKIKDPNCPPDVTPPSDFLLGGGPGTAKGVTLNWAGGNTSLEVSTLGATPPQAEFGKWTDEWTVYGPLKEKLWLFSMKTDLKFANGALWQASILPFPADDEKEYSSPAGLVASGKIDCINCTFLINLETLLPDPKAAPGKNLQAKSWYAPLLKGAGGAITATKNNLIQAGKSAFNFLVGILKGKEAGQPKAKPTQINVQKINPKDFLVPFKTTYYFRAIPLSKGVIAGNSSNVVKFHWDPSTPAEKDLDKVDFEKLQKCSVPNPPKECFPPPLPKPYKAEVLSYVPFLPPLYGHEGCFIVAKTVTFAEVSENVKKSGQTFIPPKGFENDVFANEGASYCPPPPPKKTKKAWYEVWFNYIKQAVNAYGFIWDMAKKTLVGAVSDLICPSSFKSECKGALAAGLDAAMVAMGLPPNLPNFDSLLKEGGTYFAGLAAKQIGIPDEPFKKAFELTAGDAQKELTKMGIPPEVASKLTEKAKTSFEEAVEEAKGEFSKHAMEELAAAFGTAKAASKPWVPKGVPVKPDPDGELKYPTMVVKLTRSAEVETQGYPCLTHAGGPRYTHMKVNSIIKNDKPDPTNLNHPTEDRLYRPVSLPPPKLEPGESITFPVVFEPLFNWGFPGANYTSYQEARDVWRNLYDGGEGGIATVEVSGYCMNSDTITIATAKGSYTK